MTDLTYRNQFGDQLTGQLTKDTATRRQRGAGIAMMLASSASNQTGAALGATAFPVIGPVGVVAVRQIVTALVLGSVVRPRLRALSRDQWWPILGLVVVFSVMNLSLYAAVDRIGLGLAVTLEFLGPLAVAITGTRRVLDFACAAVAGVGVVVLTNPGPTADGVGVGLALVAALAWAGYILINRALGRRLPGLQGTAAASIVTGAIWMPVAILWFCSRVPTGAALAAAAGCGLLSSIVPYAADLQALRRVSAPVFGTFASINPVWAALAGWLVLHQSLQLSEWVGIALIVASNVIVSVRGLACPEKARRRTERGPTRTSSGNRAKLSVSAQRAPRGDHEQEEEGQEADRDERGAREVAVRPAGSADQDREQAQQGRGEGDAVEERGDRRAHRGRTLGCSGREAAAEAGPRLDGPGAGQGGRPGRSRCDRSAGW